MRCGRVTPIRIRQLTPQALGEVINVSKNSHTARHRATPGHTSALHSVSKAVSSNAGSIGRPAAALAAASALVLGVGAPAQASATANEPAAVATAAPSTTAAPAPTGNTASASAAAGGSSSYTVQSGDTLRLIAAEHGVSLDTVLSLNGLSVNSVIYPGDTIAVSGSTNTAAATVSAPAPAAPEPAPTPAPAAEAAGSNSSFAASTVSLASANVTEIPASSTNAAILVSAKAQNDAGAIQDCTVLGEQALQAAGFSGVGDESPESLMSYASPVSDPQPGDFIYYADGGMGFSHNAVYIGGGKAIHSGWNGNQTVVKSVDVGSGPVYYRVNG